jgi:hypothetical protein
MSAGKGDQLRAVNGAKYRANFDRIFSPKKPKKPLKRMPTYANICQQMTQAATLQHPPATYEC